MKPATSGVNKTMLVPTLSHSTRGGQEGAALPFLVTSRCSAAFPLAESGSCTLSSVHSHVETWEEIFPPHNSVSKLGNRKLWGGRKGISRQTSKRRERKAEVGPNPTSYSHPGQRRNPRLDTHRKPRRMNRHVKYTFLYQSAKSFFSSGRTSTLMRHQ